MKLHIKKILIPTDFSETAQLAIEHASFVARLTKAELLIVHVVPAYEYQYEIPEPIMHIDDREEMRKMVEKKLSDTVTEVKNKYGIAAKAFSATGKVAGEIVQIAKDENIDLIFMGTHGVSGFNERIIGSTAQKVVALAPCPVISVQQHATKLGYSNIVLPIEHSIHSREKVSVATDLGSLFGSKIHILGLIEEKEEHAKEKMHIILDTVESAIRKSGLAFSRKTVSGDNLAVEALRYADEVNGDLIMILADEESELETWMMSAVAKQIVNHSRIPVLSLKPHYADFESVNLGGAYRFY
ncbi:MAG: universal stress protein [Bacteroidetes bacterium]|nr:universal stress protein [Bacteroidota bacterium]